MHRVNFEDLGREERRKLYAKEEVLKFEFIHICSSPVIPMVFRCWNSSDPNITRIEKSMPGQIDLFD